MLAKDQAAAIGGVAIGIVVFALKLWAWRVTGSAALYSDAMESVVNIAASLIAFVALRISAKPPDAGHPFGHQKAEYFSAIIEGALIIVAALLILHEAYQALTAPRFPDQPLLGVAVNAGATVLNAIWATLLLRWARRWRSPALRADARHLFADVATSVGVLAGFALIPLTGWLWLDPALAALVAVNVIWSGYRLIRESVGGLMDEMVDKESLERIARIVSDNAEGAIEAHDLSARSMGRSVSIELHLVVPGEMTVEASHDICDRIEEALREEANGGRVLIHVEPARKAKGAGTPVFTAM